MQTEATQPLQNLFDMVLAGGGLMIPIGACSVIALGYIVERSVRLRGHRLGSAGFGTLLRDTVREEGPGAGLNLCNENNTSTARVLAAGLKRASAPWVEREKAVEDAGAREYDRLSANLKPLVVIGMIAPLLGLLGTVWGMIDAFANISTGEGLGNPESLAAGISTALVTTAAGLAVAIPTQAAYFYYRGRIDRFVRRTEDLYMDLSDLLTPSVDRHAA